MNTMTNITCTASNSQMIEWYSSDLFRLKCTHAQIISMLPNVWPFFVLKLLKCVCLSCIYMCCRSHHHHWQFHFTLYKWISNIIWMETVNVLRSFDESLRLPTITITKLYGKQKQKQTRAHTACRMKQSTIKLIRNVVSYICPPSPSPSPPHTLLPPPTFL